MNRVILDLVSSWSIDCARHRCETAAATATAAATSIAWGYKIGPQRVYSRVAGMRRWLGVAVAAVVCGIAGAEGGVSFKGYTAAGGESYIEVVVTGDDGARRGCPADKAEQLWPQYNLASVLVPGLSPLAYNFGDDGAYDPEASWLDPLDSARSQTSNGLPEWWNKLSKPQGEGGGARAYRLRPAADGSDGPVDPLLATGLFIPEVEPDGNFWWPTTKDKDVGPNTDDEGVEPSSVNKNRDGPRTDTVCRSHPRPQVEEGDFSTVFADLEVVQHAVVRDMRAAPADSGDSGGDGQPVPDNVFERDGSTLVAVDSHDECNMPKPPPASPTSTIGNVTGYKYAPTGAVNLRLYKEANSVAAPFLRQLPLGATRLEDESINPGTDGNSTTFRDRVVKNMKRYPGMVPQVAPWGPAAAAHRSPGRPFFECVACPPPFPRPRAADPATPTQVRRETVPQPGADRPRRSRGQVLPGH